MRLLRNGLVAAVVLLFGVTACADLEVTNPNEPDAERALQTPGDIESLIGGSFNTWFLGTYDYSGPGLFLSNASFQHTAPWANAGMEKYARLPRIAIVNDPADPYYGNFTRPWYYMYRALAAVAEGLASIDEDPAIAESLGADAVTRARAYGKFVQGMAHGTLALLYDQGFIVDETTELTDATGQPVAQEAVDYNALMAAAQGYFDEAITLASGGSFTIPSAWMSVQVTADELAALAHSEAARFRANVARTPAERAAVDWDEVIADVDAGLTADWVMDMDPNAGFYNEVIDYGTYPGWAENPYFVMGMADTSGNYQRWLSIPLADRIPNPEGGPILIITPDTRFPQGTTVAEQQENIGSLYAIPCPYDEDDPSANPAYCAATGFGIGNVWARPDRGTWRWSYYWHIESQQYTYWADFNWPEVDVDEMQLLKAEGLYHNGDMPGAAAIVNVTREAAGLNATDAAGTNTDCVPRLPNGDCGDLWEMLKWEKRLESRMKGLLSAPWYFDSRGWGDLYRGTYLQFPAPCRELQVLNMLPCYTFGGSNDSSAPVSTYAYPDE